MNIPLIDLKEQYKQLKTKTNSEVSKVLSSAKYIMGENVLEFEEEFSNYLGVKHSISVANGTDALILSLKALQIGQDDEVITTPFTFFATAESIAFVGAKPVFVDVEEDTFNIDVKKIEERITKNTKAIMPVHIFGYPANMDEIVKLAKKYSLKIIEDACQAIGAEYKGKKVGAIGDIACFSFFPTKNLGCAGDGGMIVTNNDDIATIVRGLRTHGSGENGRKAYNLLNNIKENIEENNMDNETVYNPSKYYNYLIGHNSRLDAIQAAILRVKLKYIDKWNKKRQKNADYYNQKLMNTNLITPYKGNDINHVYHMYVLQSEDRNNITSYLKSKGIATGIYYPIPLHLQKAFEYLQYNKGDLPVSEYLSERTFAIPIYPELTQEQLDYIVNTIKEWGNKDEE